ncbi:hypothetical protein B1C81_12920 [Streptomyces sp. HG99]|nr:hypothetical protein B1C81_12920 [Streptomyces sp. HG99]
MRTAAGRRALQVVLLVGGLFALGFLCGERAHAADGVVPTTPTRAVESAVQRTSEGLAGGSAHRTVEAPAKPSAAEPPAKLPVRQGTSAPEAGPIPSTSVTTAATVPAITDVTDTVRHVVRPVADRVVPPAADDAVRPIGDLVETVTGGLADAPPKALPSLPSIPSAPGLPALPGVGGQTPPAGSAPQQSGGAVERQGARIGHPAGPQEADGTATSVYGPGVVVDGGLAGVHRHRDGVRAGHAPAHQAPPGDPTGALGNRSAVDNGGPRYGDPHAVTPNHRAPLRLVPGASAGVTAAETRDRYRDIPVFPG